MSVSDDIRRYAAENYVARARRAGLDQFEVTVGDIYRELLKQNRGFLNRVPQFCAALRSNKFLTQNNLLIIGESGPPSGMSTTVVLKYQFRDGADPEKVSVSSPPPSAVAPGRESSIYQRFRDLYGIAGDLYRLMGGGEHVLAEERERFYGIQAGRGQAERRKK